MNEKHAIADWMRRVMAATGWSAPYWARLAGGMASTNITRLIADPEKASSPRTDTVGKLASVVPPHLGVDPPVLGNSIGVLEPPPGLSEPAAAYVPSPAHDDGFVARPVPIPTQTQMPRTLPVYGLAQGGADGAFEMNGTVIDYVEMPPSLAGTKNPYGVYVSGESMSPRYEPGWLLHVHPHKPARPGDNVVVQIRPRDEHSPPLAYVKVLVTDHHKSGGRLVVRQFNPVKDLVWEAKDVVSVHKIVGVAHE